MYGERAYRIFVCNILPQAGINGETCMMILHKITFPTVPNMACDQFCPGVL